MREVIEVEIGYKDHRFDIRNDMGPLRDACTWASHNLALRHHIRLEGPYGKGERVYVRLYGKMDDDFNIGNHLRGISLYLMKNFTWAKVFNYKPGVGLLYFIDMSKENK